MGKKTGPACTACEHKQRANVDLALTHSVPIRTISRRFGISRDALYRHKRNHLSPQLRAAILSAVHPSEIDLEQLAKSESEGLLGALIGQRARLQMLSEMAFEEREINAAARVEGCITSSLELTSRLLGQLVTHHHTTHTTILISSDYLRLRSVITGALKPFPEAAQAVGRALAELETAAAKDITESKTPLLLEAEAQPC